MDINLNATTSFKKHIAAKKRIVISQGASRSGKSMALSQIMILKALEKKRIITIVMEYLPVLQATVLRDLQTIINDSGVNELCVYNKSKYTFTFFNGSLIELRAFNNEPNRALGGSRHILWIDECDNVGYELFSQLAIRTSEQIFLSFNPRSYFWAHSKLLDNPSYSDSIDYIHTTYVDNEYVNQEQIDEIKRRAAIDDNFKKVYLLGEVGAKLDLVYDEKNYTIIPRIPQEIVNKYTQYIGLDFGWSDSLALIECFIIPDKRGNISDIYINELYYRGETTNKQLKHVINMHALNRYLVIADSASPQNIDELKRYGINIDGVKKGADSISYGISLLRSARMHITENSLNTLKEIRNYSYAKNRQGEYILDKTGNQVPADLWNHALDAIRYTALYYIDNAVKRKVLKPIPSSRKRGIIAY